MQTDPIFLPSDEDSETQHHIFDRDLTNGHNQCWLNQVLMHRNVPTDIVEVTITNVDVAMPTLSHSATTYSQQDKNIHNVSPISDDIFFQSGPHPMEPKQLTTKDPPDSPLPSNKGPTQIFQPCDLPDTPALYNDPEQRQINAVAQELKQMALHAHSKVQKQNSGCIECGKPYEQVLEETVTEYLQHTKEICETVRE